MLIQDYRVEGLVTRNFACRVLHPPLGFRHKQKSSEPRCPRSLGLGSASRPSRVQGLGFN